MSIVLDRIISRKENEAKGIFQTVIPGGEDGLPRVIRFGNGITGAVLLEALMIPKGTVLIREIPLHEPLNPEIRPLRAGAAFELRLVKRYHDYNFTCLILTPCRVWKNRKGTFYTTDIE